MSSTSQRRNLSVDRILQEAGRIVRHEGADALTMRRLADECSVTPMALYHHVKDKDQVLELVLDSVVAEMLDIELSGKPDEKLIAFCEGIYTVMMANPGVGRYWTSVGVTVPNMATVTERLFELLTGCGVTGERAADGLDCLVVFIVGAVAYNLSRPPGVRYRLLEDVDPDATPLLAELIDLYAARDPDRQFRNGLHALWSGLSI